MLSLVSKMTVAVTRSSTHAAKAKNRALRSPRVPCDASNHWTCRYSSTSSFSTSNSKFSPSNAYLNLNVKAQQTSFTRPISKQTITASNPAHHWRQSRRSLFIRTETTPNPDSMKFMPDQQLLDPGQSIDFENAMAATRSPLAKALFRNESVQRVFIGSSFVTVTKDEESSWDELKAVIFADLMEFLSSGEPVLLGEAPVSDTTITAEDSEDVALIKTLIETRIRPSIQDDGGDLTYKGFIDGVVFLQLQGSCTSCPSSTVTLKNGIEKMLKHWSSAVISVVSIESEEEWQRILSGQPASEVIKPDAPPTPLVEEATINPSSKRQTAHDDL